MKNLNDRQKYRICVILAVILAVINLSPLVLAEGKMDPKLLGVPYTLWMNIVSTCALVGLTYVGSRFLLRNIKDDE